MAALSIAQADTGWMNSYAYTFNGIGDTYYDLNASDQASNFNGADLGIYNSTATLFLNAQINAWADGGDSYTDLSLWYRIGPTGNVTGSFTQVSAASIFSIGGNDFRGIASGVNLLDVPSLGIYDVQAYLSRSHVWPGGGPFTAYMDTAGTNFNVPTGNFFTATYEVIPEPSTFAMLALMAGGLGMSRRRRKQS